MVAAFLLHLFSLVCLFRRIEPFMYSFYVLAWWSYIFFLDALLGFRGHKSLTASTRLPLLVVVSSAFWCLFELINLRLQNWFYINIPRGEIRYLGYLLSFGTVIPGIYLTREAVRRVLGEIPVKPVHIKGKNVLIFSGLLALALLLLFPRLFFALTWVFFIPLMDILNYRQGRTSFMGSLEKGEVSDLVSTLLAGMICGFLWELWNYWAISKWVYTVPIFEDIKLFEMPVLGYLGFAFFAMETIAFFNCLSEARLFMSRPVVTALLALAVCFLTFPVIDRHTVFSYLTPVDSLPLDKSRSELFQRQGVMSSHGIDPALLTPAEKRFLDLIHLKGLGLAHTLRLRDQGIESIEDLSKLSPDRLCRIIDESNRQRCRVYVKAAGGNDLSY